MSQNTIIAIDGHASTGKSTLAKRLAAHLGYTYIDTGYMFRVISYHVLEKQWFTAQGEIDQAVLKNAMPTMQFGWDQTNQNEKLLACNGRVYGTEIRSPEVANLVSQVAAIPAVREHLLQQQRNLAETANVVMDGRDIGTVVFPEATHKFFLTAKAEIRAQRRFDEMCLKGIETSYSAVLKNVIERDRLDETREIAPLKQATDAIAIDTSAMDLEAVFSRVCDHLTS